MKTRLRHGLLVCGALSSLLYIATDLIGGLNYPGYSFTSQTISELGAVGAPSKPLVDPLFTIYNLLVIAFAVGVFSAAARIQWLRSTGVLLFAYGAIGLGTFVIAGPNAFAMQQRGVGNLSTDLPHIILTGVLVVLMIMAIVSAALALDKRFRIYSLVTLVIIIALSAATAPYGARLAAGQPTPGFGIVERIEVYALMLWLAVLSIVLLRRASRRDVSVIRTTSTPHVAGTVAPGFEEVRTEFERNFAERGEIGAAVAAYWHGDKVVDLWGGRRRPDSDALWKEDTLVIVHSTTKGLAAMTVAIANARGWLDYDAPVAQYWPEFGQNGKAAITVRQLLAHEAGLVLLDEELSLDKMRNLDYLAGILARQQPAWQPGTRHGYHAMTVGLYMQELIRHVDPQHRTLGQFFRDEIAGPLGIEFYIGLPPDIPDARVAKTQPLSRKRALLSVTHATPALLRRVLWPGSLLRRSLAIPSDVDFNDRRYLEVELPAGNGVGTARAVARVYSVFAEGGGELGITPETFARITAPPVVARPIDEVLGVPAYFSLGFARPGPEQSFGASPGAFGFPGAGGSFAFADPDAHLAFAYVMNKLDFYLVDDPREKALRDAVYRAVAKLSVPEKSALPVEFVHGGALVAH